jgi:hypothetical protein
MRSRPEPVPHAGHAAWWVVTLALLVALGSFTAGCSRQGRERSAAPSGADTLANGLPRVLVPMLDAWVGNWRRAAPGFTAESLACVARGPFRFEYGSPAGGKRFVEGVRARALVEMLSPDSTRVLDYDRYAAVSDEGGFGLEREPDSAPMLLDMARDTLWTISFCGTPCFYDGGGWLDATRFSLTGATQSGEQADGPWQGFVEVHDLRTHERTRWALRPVDDEAFQRYRAASDSLLLARFAAAGSQAVTTSRAN